MVHLSLSLYLWYVRCKYIIIYFIPYWTERDTLLRRLLTTLHAFFIFAHTWNPNDPCFDWSLGLVLEGWPLKIEVVLGYRYRYTDLHTYHINRLPLRLEADDGEAGESVTDCRNAGQVSLRKSWGHSGVIILLRIFLGESTNTILWYFFFGFPLLKCIVWVGNSSWPLSLEKLFGVWFSIMFMSISNLKTVKLDILDFVGKL